MVDVLVFAVFLVDHIFDHDAVWRGDLLEVGDFDSFVRWDDFYVEAGFFFDFTKSRLGGIFVGIDMTSGREPFLNLFVPVKQRGIAVNDEASCSEVSCCDLALGVIG